MRMTVSELQSRLVAYMEALGANVRGIKGIFMYYGLTFVVKTKLKELIAALPEAEFLLVAERKRNLQLTI